MPTKRRRRNAQVVHVSPSFDALEPFSDSDTPSFVGERWSKTGNQTLTSGDETFVNFEQQDISMELLGYPALWQQTINSFIIPAGLSGIWQVYGQVRFDADATATGHRNVNIERYDARNSVYITQQAVRMDAGNTEMSLVFATAFYAHEGDLIDVDATQSSGGDLNVIGGDVHQTHVILQLVGVGQEPE